MKASKLYEAALGILGEEEYSSEDFTHLRFRAINQGLSLCLSSYNTILISEGKEPLDSFPLVVNDASEILLPDNFALSVLAYFVAAFLCSDHDRDKANVLSDIAYREMKKYSKVNFCDIKNHY